MSGPESHTTEALAYLERMGVDPDAFGIISWIDRQLEADQEFDHKYARRLIDALIIVKGGRP